MRGQNKNKALALSLNSTYQLSRHKSHTTNPAQMLPSPSTIILLGNIASLLATAGNVLAPGTCPRYSQGGTLSIYRGFQNTETFKCVGLRKEEATNAALREQTIHSRASAPSSQEHKLWRNTTFKQWIAKNRHSRQIVEGIVQPQKQRALKQRRAKEETAGTAVP